MLHSWSIVAEPAPKAETPREGAPTADALGDPQLGPAAERAFSDFYDEQALRSKQERDRLEKCTSSFHVCSSSKWNRQELYLDEERREQALAKSRRHLARHPAWFEGLTKLDPLALREVVAMQHFLQVDLEDLSLPEGERRSEDSYSGAGGNVCNQMLLDAARSCFIVEGEEFDFSMEYAGHGCTAETNPCEVDQLQQAFSDRLIAAVLRCLGEDPPPRLTRAVTTALSQSGLANVERACDTSQVVVSGCDHSLRYDLQALEAGVWEIVLSTRKSGFEQCILYGAQWQGAAALNENFSDPAPVACSPKSFLAKTCRLRLSSGPGGTVEGDVLELRKEFRLLDPRGHPLPGLAPSTTQRSSLDRMRLLAKFLLCFCFRCSIASAGALVGAVAWLAGGFKSAPAKSRPARGFFAGY